MEIGPNVWIEIEEWLWYAPHPTDPLEKEGHYRLRIPYDSKVLEVSGKGFPVVLREHEKRLYLVVVGNKATPPQPEPPPKDRPRAPHFYYRQEGEKFLAIAPSDFPKRIAGTNLGYFPDQESLKAEIQLDTASDWFYSSPTVFIWAELLTGKAPRTVDKELLDEFVRTYQPIKLTAIVRPATSQPSGPK